ncbi:MULTISPECIES: CHC2 zinc finger domain-containing protein [Alicyclobacillus]|uniref:Zinc finger CHC2-type domain-containing protein n=3 Tax=Alicyclobacillus TaxID=29330 RepID=C8WYC3_ALIAD|nr:MULTISPECIES: CHC2 zinc finger domain-containing protein [Alicyclobacillus]ACV60017.1 hypothetical protein Aaci_3014 [Alicyclobacillus acidocaldarius subsp. acidocaldarius DSM 446]MBF8376460.1 hypothetical protein [Alicyclobacillus mali (ex Roth et al. 2021)]SIT11295.1 CHC2 zinc finger [Alicyclobacillus vulcanalis]
MVSIEEVAARNGLVLYPTSRPGQWKAHCPVCGDQGRNFHLYVSSVKDTFYCHKCGEKGGAVAFHAWLRGISFEAAKAELYPQGTRKRNLHPAERLTAAQLAELGFTTRKPWRMPKGVDPLAWRRQRKAMLDWIWEEYQGHERFKREQTERLMRLLTNAHESTCEQPTGA